MSWDVALTPTVSLLEVLVAFLGLLGCYSALRELMESLLDARDARYAPTEVEEILARQEVRGDVRLLLWFGFCLAAAALAMLVPPPIRASNGLQVSVVAIGFVLVEAWMLWTVLLDRADRKRIRAHLRAGREVGPWDGKERRAGAADR